MLGIEVVQGTVLPEWIDIRKVSPWPDAILERIAAFAARQGAWGWPPEAGKQMTLPHPIYSARIDD